MSAGGIPGAVGRPAAVRRALGCMTTELLRPARRCRQLSGGRAVPGRWRVRFAGRCGAPGGNNVETPHPVETKHANSVFCFRRTKGFHANGRPVPDGQAAARRTVLKGTTPPLS